MAAAQAPLKSPAETAERPLGPPPCQPKGHVLARHILRNTGAMVVQKSSGLGESRSCLRGAQQMSSDSKLDGREALLQLSVKFTPGSSG